jgi:glutamyl-tRNA reductase
MSTTIQIISINHKYTSAACRKSWMLDDTQLTALGLELSALGVDGYVTLQTCNRVELVFTAPVDRRMAVMDVWQGIAGGDDLATDQVKTYIGNGVTMRYLLKMATGLQSAIVGDDQILAQMKKAWEAARSRGSLSTLLERSYQAFMRYHKTICKETDFKAHSVSLAYHAWRSIAEASSLKGKRVLILGAGDMAAQVLKYASKFNPGHLLLANRTRSRAEALIGDRGFVVDYDQVAAMAVDVVINCSPVGLAAVAGMTTPPSRVIDLALPSDVDGTLMPHYLSLEALQQKIDRSYRMRLGSLPRVMRILEAATDEFASWSYAWQQRRREMSA